MEKKFRDWLARCHATLDKSIRFEALVDSKTQVNGGGQAVQRSPEKRLCSERALQTAGCCL